MDILIVAANATNLLICLLALYRPMPLALALAQYTSPNLLGSITA
jgi:hypothetical protein